MTPLSIRYKPRSWFQPFHARKQRFTVGVAHRRCGKTEGCLGDVVIRALSTKKKYARYAYMAPFKSQGVAVAWDRLQRIVGPDILPYCVVSKSDKSIELPNGAKIFIMGADNYDAIRGQYFDGIVLDEVGDMHPDAWSLVILPALSEREGWATFIGTPKGKNFFWEMREKARFNDDGNWFYFDLPLSLTHLLPQAEIDLQKSLLDEDEYLQEYECSFDAAIKGSYWAKQLVAAKDANHIGPIKHVKVAPVHMAFDLGWDDSTAIWFYQVVNGQHDVLHYYEVSGQSIKEIWDDVLEIAKVYDYRLGDTWLPHDAKHHSLQTGKTMVQQLRMLGARPRLVPNEGLQQGIQAVRASIPKMRIDDSREHCYDGLEALKAYSKKWSEKLGTFSREPNHDWASHAADAFRYMCLAVRDEDITATKPVDQPPEVNPSEEAFKRYSSRSVNRRQPMGIRMDDLWTLPTLDDDYVRI